MKNQVGIINYHRALNYGAVLQAYALQQSLFNLGYDNAIIDYNSPAIKKQYKLKFPSSVKNIKFNLAYLLRIKRAVRFKKFRKNNLVMTKQCNIKSIDNYGSLFKNVIVGSDQVWNLPTNNFDLNYLLKFVNSASKKISYAASMGKSTVSESEVKAFTNNLKEFSHISVREQKAKELLSGLYKQDISVHLDSVFLLDKSNWKSIIGKAPNEKYVLVYQLIKSETLLKYARELAKTYNCKIFIISKSLSGSLYNKNGIIDKSNCGPQEFLSLLYYAEHVVTNSFHGTAFSVIFNKKFNVEFVKSADVNSRFTNILSKFKLEDRILEPNKKIQTDFNDYTEINLKIANEIRNAETYLISALEDNNDKN